MPDDTGAAVPIEIERKFLLRECPPLPDGVETLRLEQGYLGDAVEDASGVERLRRIRYPDGTARCVHTIKRGTGLVREEIERDLAPAEFEALWPGTEGARLVKSRHRLSVGDVRWVIDVYDDLDLVLAEAELPTVETESPAPPWLAPAIVREVTDDPAYTNAAIARRLKDA